MNYRRIRIVRVGNSPVIDFAAKEMKRYLQLADPSLAVDEVIRQEFRGDEKTITLKVCPALPAALQVEDPFWDDGYAINVQNDYGMIRGTNERSVLLGVYRFLKELGFGFTRPGKEGERIPGQLPLNYEIKVTEKAAYRHRGVTIEGADMYQNIADMIDFLPKCGMNEYFIQFWVPSTFFERWYYHRSTEQLPREEISREEVAGFVASLEEEMARRGILYHKTGHGWTCEPFGIEGTTWDHDRVYELTEEARSYLAEVKGKRELWGNIPLNTNLCYSNPMVREKIAAAIGQYAVENPQIDVIHFWLADGNNNHCECENCRKKRPSDWYAMMLNQVDAELAKVNSPAKVVFLIYVDLLWEPQEIRLENPDRFILMFAPITRFYGVNYADSKPFEGELPPYERNKLEMPKDLSQNLARLAKWQEQFKGDSFIFDYHLQWAYLADPGCDLAARNMFDDMLYLKNMGLNGNVSCQVQRCFFPSGLEFRALADALWKGEGSFEDMKAAYYAEAYGERGQAVSDYLTAISNLFTIYPYYRKEKPATAEEETEHTRPYGLPYVKDMNRLETVLKDFAPVIEEGLQEGGQEKADWTMLKLHQEYVRKLALVLQLTDEEKTEERDAAIEDMAKYIGQIELDVQKALDGENAARLLRGHYQGAF
ncbi:MAG: DUF4838 domain-containing protein [Lachnospiraceae bacterium]|nr:DUF4838 domain-containing protein [Lachnospiraceae bacterium]